MMRRAYWAVAVIVALLFVVEAWQMYPAMETDSLWFLPAAVNYAKGEPHLVNNLHPQAQAFDHTHAGLFAFYPPGLPWFLGILAPEASPRGVYILLALIDAVALLLFARLLEQRLRVQHEVSPGAAYGLGMGAVLCLATYESSFCLGRPDFLATLLLLAGWMAYGHATDRTRWIWAGVTFGLVCFVQPVAALFSSALYGAWCAARHTLRGLIGALLPAYGLGVAVLALLLIVNPNGFQTIADGVTAHSHATLIHGTEAPFLKYFLYHSYSTGYGLLFLAGLALLGYGIWRRWQQLASRGWMIFFLLLFAVLYHHFVSIALDRLYNLWLLTPFLLLLFFALGFEVLQRYRQRKIRVVLVSVAVLLLAVGSIGFLHRTLLFGFALTDEFGYAQASQKARELLAERPPGMVAVSKSLWVFFDDYRNIRSFGLHPSEAVWQTNYLFLQQRYALLKKPPEIPGFRLAYDNFTGKEARFLGLSLSPTFPSYRFAFYEREGAASAAVPAPNPAAAVP